MTQPICSPFVCQECGSVRLRTPSGTVCPNGHGRIHPPATARQLETARRHQWAAKLPLAANVGPSRWTIEGLHGEWQRAPFNPKADAPNFVPTGATCTDGVLAVSIGERICVRRYVSVFPRLA